MTQSLSRRQLAAVMCLWSVLFLLPFGRAAELPIVIAAIYALLSIVRDPRRVLEARFRLAALGFLAYWLPELVSAFDSVAADKSWLEVVADLRYLPFAVFVIDALATQQARRQLAWWSALLVLFWIVDALVQAAFGTGFGGALESDRVSGIFGDDNLKLGPVLAVLTPVTILVGLNRYGRRVALILWGLAAIAVLLAGARGGWVGFAVATLALLWRVAHAPRRFAIGIAFAGMAAAVLVGGGYLLSERVAARVDRTLAALDGTRGGLDTALAYRLSIWETAMRMSLAHPLNGVGVRAFRHDYAAHATSDDRWLEMNPGEGAFHAHHWLLEVASETGAFGLACWFALIAVLWRRWRALADDCRHAAAPYSVAMLVLLFPLNTHFAFYSSIWSNLYFWVLLVWIAHLRPARGPQP